MRGWHQDWAISLRLEAKFELPIEDFYFSTGTLRCISLAILISGVACATPGHSLDMPLLSPYSFAVPIASGSGEFCDASFTALEFIQSKQLQ